MHQKCTRAVFYLHYSDIDSSPVSGRVSQSQSPNRADVWLLEWEFVRACGVVAYATAASFVFGHGRSRLFLPFLLPNLAAPFNPDPPRQWREEGGNPFSLSLHLLRCISLAVLSLWQLMELQLQWKDRGCTLTVSFLCAIYEGTVA